MAWPTCMKRSGWRAAPGLLLAVTLAAPAGAMDLLQAYNAALAQDATVRAARAAADAGREQLPQAQAQLRPSVNLRAARNLNRLTRTQEDFFGQPSTSQERYYSQSQALSLRQPLYRKSLLAGVDQARAAVEDSEASLQSELQNLAVRVSGAYLDALLAQDQLALVLAQKAATTVQLDAARKAMTAGSGTRTDIDEAQARLDLVQAQELEARQQEDLTRRQLEVLVNQPVPTLAPLDASAMPLLPPVPASVAEWVQRAEDGSPELRALRARLDTARAAVDKAQGAHYPTLDAVAEITRSASENVTSPASSYRQRTIGLQLNVPLYQGGGVDSAVRQAVAERTRAEELLEAARRDLGVRVHREFRGATEGVLQVRAREQALRSADQVVNSSRRSFEAGTRTRVDILNAEQSRQQAVRDLAHARYSWLLARVRLQALAGGDTLQAVTEINGWLRAR